MFKSVSPFELTGNTFRMINDQWMLIAAGDESKCNMMTASWGGLGIMWGKPCATVYIRPQRYTREFVDCEEYLSLTFFDESKRDMLRLCGSKSGRDCDKAALGGITPVFDKAAPYFAESELVMICRKLYCQRLEPECCVDKDIDKWYESGDYHYMYICEITDVLQKQ